MAATMELKTLEEDVAKQAADLEPFREKIMRGLTKEEDAEFRNATKAFDEAKAKLDTAGEIEDRQKQVSETRAKDKDLLKHLNKGKSAPSDGDEDGDETLEGILKKRELGRSEMRSARALMFGCWLAHANPDLDFRMADEHELAAKLLGWDKPLEHLRESESIGQFSSSRQFRNLQNAIRGIRGAEYRATVTTTTDPASIGETWDSELERTMLHFGAMLQLGRVRTTPRGGTIHLTRLDDTANEAVIIAEAASHGEEEVSTTPNTLGAFGYSSRMIKFSAEFEQDDVASINQEAGSLIGERFGRGLNRDFTVGDGVSKPTGIVPAITGITNTAGAGVLAATDLLDLIYGVDRAYRPGGTIMCHDNQVLRIRKLVDGNGQFLWSPGLQAGEPDRVLSYPISVNNHMDGGIATNDDIIVFGQINKYEIRLVRGIRIERAKELFLDTNEIGVIGYARADGVLNQQAAVRKLRVS